MQYFAWLPRKVANQKEAFERDIFFMNRHWATPSQHLIKFGLATAWQLSGHSSVSTLVNRYTLFQKKHNFNLSLSLGAPGWVTLTYVLDTIFSKRKATSKKLCLFWKRDSVIRQQRGQGKMESILPGSSQKKVMDQSCISFDQHCTRNTFEKDHVVLLCHT